MSTRPTDIDAAHGSRCCVEGSVGDMDALVAAFDAVKLGVTRLSGIDELEDTGSSFAYPAGDAIDDEGDSGGTSSSESSGSAPSSVASSESGDAVDLSASSSNGLNPAIATSLVQDILRHQQAQEAATALLSQLIVDDREYYTHHHELGGTPILSRLGLKPIQLLLNVRLL